MIGPVLMLGRVVMTGLLYRISGYFASGIFSENDSREGCYFFAKSYFRYFKGYYWRLMAVSIFRCVYF